MLRRNYEKSRLKEKSRTSSGRFIKLPAVVLDSNSYRELSPTASRVLMIIHHQYRGKNNGNLSAPLSLAKKWGIKSSATLVKALKELQHVDLIRRTRDPTRDRISPRGQCSLLAITWESIDDCAGKHDYQSTITPLRKFSLEKSIS